MRAASVGASGGKRGAEMVALNISGMQVRKAKRKSNHQQQRQLAIAKLNKRKREKARVGQNPLVDYSGDRKDEAAGEAAGEAWTGVAQYDYEPSELDEIGLQEGDVVEAVVDTGDGWAKGTNARTGKTGTFPLSYIE